MESEEKGQNTFIQDEKIKQEIEEKNLTNLKYIANNTKFPITTNNDVDYYNLGDKTLPVMLEELKKAEKFIFFEYFTNNYRI